MIYYKDKDEEGHLIIWRYFCQDMDPGHVLEFTDFSDYKRQVEDIEVSIVNAENLSLWRRIKQAFTLLFGRRVYYMSVVISGKDRQELGKAILGEFDAEVPETPIS